MRKKKTVVLTGALGFIGTEVASTILQRDDLEVILVDFWKELIPRYEEQQYPIIRPVYSNMAKAFDVIEPTELITLIRDGIIRADVIVHLGACVNTIDIGSAHLFQRNVDYTRELIMALDRHDVSPIIFASSASVYGTAGYPSNPYGLTKSLGEHIVTRYGGPNISLRFFNVFGQFEHHKLHMASMPFKLAQAYHLNTDMRLHSPLASRDFVPVGNVRLIIMKIIDLMLTGDHGDSEIHDLGTGESTSFTRLNDLVMSVMGQTVSRVQHVPMPKHLVERYQDFTMASMHSLSQHLHGLQLMTTFDGIKEYYGNR